RDHGVDRAHVDDGAGAPAGLDLRDHPPRSGLVVEARVLERHTKHAVELGLRQVEADGAMDDAGIVDDNVEVAERAAGFSDHVLGVARVADVGGHEAGLAERTRLGLAGGGVDVGDGDARTLGDVTPCDREPDAVRGAGDDRDLVLEPHATLRASVEGSTRLKRVVPAKAGTHDHRPLEYGSPHTRGDYRVISAARTGDRETSRQVRGRWAAV